MFEINYKLTDTWNYIFIILTNFFPFIFLRQTCFTDFKTTDLQIHKTSNFYYLNMYVEILLTVSISNNYLLKEKTTNLANDIMAIKKNIFNLHIYIYIWTLWFYNRAIKKLFEVKGIQLENIWIGHLYTTELASIVG